MGAGDLQMVSGDRFMQRKRGHFPLGPGLWFIKIDKVGTGARSIGRAGTVVGGGGVRRCDGGDGLYTVWLARERAEDLHQVRIDGLGQGLVSFKQIVGRLVKELGIGAQELEELLTRTLEACLLEDLVHLTADPSRLAQPDLVDLIRRDIGGGEVPDFVSVALGAVEDLPNTDLVKASRQILAHKELLELLEGRHDLLLDSLA